MKGFCSQFLENSKNLMCKLSDSVRFLEKTVNSNNGTLKEEKRCDMIS